MTEEFYHKLGLIGELLSVSTFKVEHFQHVAAALTFVTTERLKYEEANKEADNGHALGTESEVQESPKPRRGSRKKSTSGN